MNKVRTLIADDEPLARKGLRRLLQDDERIEIVGECRNGRETVQVIQQMSPDLVFLDIQMPGWDGFQVLERIDRSRPPLIVFVTAYDKHAIQAFEVNALDYLLKPFSDGRFRAALERALKAIADGRIAELSRRMASLIDVRGERESREGPGDPAPGGGRPAPKRPRRCIPVREAGKISFVDMDEIVWFEALDYYVNIHTRNSTHLIRESLKDLEKSLDPRKFVRLHRSAIVRFKEIESILPQPTGRFAVRLRNGTELPLSRKRKRFLDDFLL